MGRHVRELYRAMAERGDVEIDLLVGGPGEEPTEYLGCTKHVADKLVCWKPRVPNMSSLLIADLQLTKTLAKLLAQGQTWDVIHVHEWNALQVARVARDALGVPVVGTMHLCITELMRQDATPDGRYGEADIYLMQQEGHLVVDSDELILCSQSYVDLVRNLFMTDRPINLIHNGIRPSEWRRDEAAGRRAREEFDLPDRPIALFVGRIADMKGIRELLDAVRRWDSGYCVVVAGEINANTDDEKERWVVTRKLRDTVKKYPDRMRWVGFQHDDKLRGLYSAAEVGLVPSLHEPFGIVALEHMAMGVPLVTTEVDGLGEIVVDGEGNEFSLIVEPGKSGQIHRALKFLRNHPEAREELAELGRLRVLDFDWHAAAAATVEVYRKVVRDVAATRQS
jgi:glycosyltransferase involved in cell wall biosynthesis